MKNVPTNLKNMKSKVDKLHVDKLVAVPVDLSKLSDAVKNDVVTKDVNNAQIKSVENKIPDITNAAINATLNAKINVVKNERPIITNLTTSAALTTAENKIPKFSYLVKKAYYDAKTSEIKIKYFTTSDYNNFTSWSKLC